MEEVEAAMGLRVRCRENHGDVVKVSGLEGFKRFSTKMSLLELLSMTAK